MADSKVKGVGARASRDHIIRVFGEDKWREILARVPEQHRKDMAEPLAFAWYSTEGVGATWQGLHELCCTPQTTDAVFRALGAFIAEDNLTTIYKVVLAFAKPDHIFGMLPKLWTTYFHNIEVTLERDAKERRGVCTVRGLPVYAVAPAAAGWIEFAYRKVGAKSASAIERGWAAGKTSVDPMVFDISWEP